MTLAVVLFVGYILWSSDGGDEYISHLVCRLMLWRAGSMPLNYRRFLDYAAERILFRKVGDVYVFTHRLLRDYFASVGSTLDEKEKAIAVYDQAIALDPDNADAYYRRGNAYYKLNEYKKAIADYEKAIVLDPDYAQAYIARGDAYKVLHKYDKPKGETTDDYEKAIADYEKAIALDPDNADAYYRRGNAYYKLKALHKYDETTDDYERAIADYEKAIADYEKAIALDSDNADAYYRRGNAYYELNEYKRAIADYEKAIALDPDYAQAYYRRGNAYQALHKYDAIKDEYEKAIADYERAIADYEKAIALNPDYKSDQSLILNYLYVFDHLPSPQHSALQKELMLIWSRRARSRL